MNASGALYVYGAGGHGKVILEILERCGVRPQGVFDDAAAVDRLLDYPVTAFPGPFDFDHDALIIAIGSNAVRQQKAETLGVQFGLAVHPATTISGRVSIDVGTVVMASVTINVDTAVGAHCIINTSASIDHDCVIEDYAHVSPNATLCGEVHVGEGTHIGAGAVVIPGVKIGRWAIVGAGAVVIRDVPDGATVVGSPARPR